MTTKTELNKITHFTGAHVEIQRNKAQITDNNRRALLKTH